MHEPPLGAILSSLGAAALAFLAGRLGRGVRSRGGEGNLHNDTCISVSHDYLARVLNECRRAADAAEDQGLCFDPYFLGFIALVGFLAGAAFGRCVAGSYCCCSGRRGPLAPHPVPGVRAGPPHGGAPEVAPSTALRARATTLSQLGAILDDAVYTPRSRRTPA